MKIQITYFICAFFSMTLLIGCGGEIDMISDARLTLHPLSYKYINSKDEIEHFIDSIKVVELSSEQCMLSIIKKILVLDDGSFIIMDKNGVFEFSAQGVFVREYSRKGRGPNEYISLADISVAGNTLLILDAMNKVLYYDTVNGGFLKNIVPKLREKILRQDGILACNSGGFYIYSANTNVQLHQQPYYCLHKFDASGRYVEEFLPCNSFTIPISAITQGINGTNLVKPLNDEVIWRVENDEIYPAFKLDFEGKYAPASSIYTNGLLDMQKYIESDYYKNIIYLNETDTYLTFHVVGPESEAYNFICNKTMDSGIVLFAPDRITVPIVFFGNHSGFLYSIMDKYSEKGLQKRADPLTSYIVSRVGYLHEDSNPKLIGVKFKF